MPWIYEDEPPKHPKVWKYAPPPKDSSRLAKKAQKIEDIKLKMKDIDKMHFEYRKEKIDTRRYKGFEKIAQELYPSWLDEIKGKGGPQKALMKDGQLIIDED